MNKEQLFDEIERIISDTETAINEELGSQYARECAKMTAYNDIVELLFGEKQ